VTKAAAKAALKRLDVFVGKVWEHDFDLTYRRVRRSKT
jgi:hypothetical protein